MPPEFAERWRQIAARRFMFHLDPRRRGTLPIRAVLSSPHVGELLALQGARVFGCGVPARASLAPLLTDSIAAADPGATNAFSLASSMALHKQFCELDVDCDGVLSADEFEPYTRGAFTPLCAQRVFAVHVQRRQARRAASVLTAAHMSMLLTLVRR